MLLVWAVLLVGSVLFNDPQQANGQSLETTAFFRQAEEQLGPVSRVQWMEPGDNSLSRWEPRKVVELTGVIVEWDPAKLSMVRPTGQAATTFPGDQVIGIEVGWKLEAFAQVHQSFKKQDFAEVVRAGQAALQLTGAPRWQQRLLVCEMVESASAMGQWQLAGKIFGYMVRDDPPMLLLAVLPVPWSDESLTVGKSMREAALGWIDEDSPALQLMGASWLMSGDQRGKAVETLQRLARSDRPVITEYARSQLWRTSPPNELLSSQYATWVQERDAMPIVVQAGPTMLMAYRLQQLGEWELAVGEWLRIASLGGDRYHLKRSAIDRAIATCKAAGATAEAERISARYSTSAGSNP